MSLRLAKVNKPRTTINVLFLRLRKKSVKPLSTKSEHSFANFCKNRVKKLFKS